MSTPRRAFITGLGPITSLGMDAAAYWQGLLAGRNGVAPLAGPQFACFAARFGAAIETFDAKSFFEKKDRKRLGVMSRPFQLAAACSRLALQDAGLTPEQLDPTRLATVLGAGNVPNEPVEFARGGCVSTVRRGEVDLHRWGQEGMSLVPPMFMLSYIPNMVGCHVSVLNNAQGPSNTITQTDVAGILAVGEARRYLRRNQADLVLVGGADTRLTAISMVRHQLMMPLSRRNEAPERASRPFDRDRDGMVLGEGGCLFALEGEDHARRRGARLYAEVVGFASAYDTSAERGFGRWRRGGVPSEREAPYASRPGRAHGLAQAIRLALRQAGITPADLDHVNAHGYSTIADDIWEALGLAEALGGDAVPIFTPKSRFGTLGVGGGPAELAASVLALHHGILPASLNYEQPDPRCPVRVVTEPRPVTKPYFLKVSFTELGQCAAVVCRKAE